MNVDNLRPGEIYWFIAAEDKKPHPTMYISCLKPAIKLYKFLIDEQVYELMIVEIENLIYETKQEALDYISEGYLGITTGQSA